MHNFLNNCVLFDNNFCKCVVKMIYVTNKKVNLTEYILYLYIYAIGI